MSCIIVLHSNLCQTQNASLFIIGFLYYRHSSLGTRTMQYNQNWLYSQPTPIAKIFAPLIEILWQSKVTSDAEQPRNGLDTAFLQTEKPIVQKSDYKKGDMNKQHIHFSSETKYLILIKSLILASSFLKPLVIFKQYFLLILRGVIIRNFRIERHFFPVAFVACDTV